MIDDFPFVGREAELGQLGDILDSARSGRGRTAFLRGGAGIGKSRLAQVVADQAHEDGWRVAIGRAFPVESAGPYAIFTDALTPVLTELGSSALQILTRGSEDQLAPIFPFLSPGDRRLQVELDPSESKTRLLWNFARFLIRLANRQPLFLVFEDLHWADDSSIELLHFVARLRSPRACFPRRTGASRPFSLINPAARGSFPRGSPSASDALSLSGGLRQGSRSPEAPFGSRPRARCP